LAYAAAAADLLLIPFDGRVAARGATLLGGIDNNTRTLRMQA
jgi:hypothetical protein